MTKKTLINKVVECNFVQLCAGSQTYCAIQYFYIYVQIGAWVAKVGIHPGRKKPAITLHKKLVMVTWCQGALLNLLKLLHHRKLLTCCAMARADDGLRGEQSFTVTCAGGERLSTLCTQKLVPVKCKTSSWHFVKYFQGWNRKFYSHTSKPLVCFCFCWSLSRSSLTSLLLRLIRPPKLGSQEVILMWI